MIKARVGLIFLICLPAVFLQQNGTTFNQTQQRVAFNVQSKLDTIAGGLIYDVLDLNGNTVQRIEKFFPVPPIPECSQINQQDLMTSFRRQNIITINGQNVSTSNILQCCDYYIPSLGYQFTQCGQNLGIFILDDRRGTALDQNYINQQLQINNISWNGLVALLNQYCQTQGYQGNYTSFLNINVPWDQWYSAYTNNPDMSNWTKNDLQQWIQRFQVYANAGGQNFQQQNQGAYQGILAQPGNGRRRLQAGPDNAPSVNNIIRPVNNQFAPSPESQRAANAASPQQQQQEQQQQQNPNDYWLNDYNNPLITQQTIIQNLTDRGIYPRFLNWYLLFFYPNGFVTQYYQAQNVQNGVISPNDASRQYIGTIPAGLIPIVNWISTLVTTQIKGTCGNCVSKPPSL